MDKLKFITDTVNEYFKNNEQDALRNCLHLLENKKILSILKSIFNSTNVRASYINTLSKNINVRFLLEKYVEINNIEIIYDYDGIDLELEEQYSDDDVKHYLQEIRRIPMLTDEQQNKLLFELSEGNNEVRELLITSNLRLPVVIAKTFRNYFTSSLSFLDVIQMGNIGLMRSIDEFNPKLGYKLSTYATTVITREIIRHMSDHSRTIRIPRESLNRIKNIKKEMEIYKLKVGVYPTDDYLTSFLGITKRELGYLKNNLYDVHSLDEEIEDNSKFTTLGDCIEDISCNVEEQVLSKITTEELSELIASAQLNEKEKKVIEYYCLNNWTLVAIGKNILGEISRERVRQIRNRGIQKIRKIIQEKEYFD